MSICSFFKKIFKKDKSESIFFTSTDKGDKDNKKDIYIGNLDRLDSDQEYDNEDLEKFKEDGDKWAYAIMDFFESIGIKTLYNYRESYKRFEVYLDGKIGYPNIVMLYQYKTPSSDIENWKNGAIYCGRVRGTFEHPIYGIEKRDYNTLMNDLLVYNYDYDIDKSNSYKSIIGI